MSYNSLHVPLDIGTWQCTLVLTKEYFSLGGGFWEPFADWDERKKQERLIEDERRTFDRYFRPSYDFRRLIATDIDAIRSFLSDHLNVAHWNLPTDNAGIERALKQAVADGKLMPIVDRDRRTPAQTSRPTPAPLRWPPSGGGGSVAQVVPYVGRLSASVGGRPSLGVAGKAASISDDGGSGFDWLGVTESVAGAVLGSDADAVSDGGGELADAVDDSLTPLGDAQPFTYAESAAGDIEQDAGVFLTPAEEAECQMQLNADMDECSAWYAAKPSSWGTCRERAMQRYANCLRGIG